jgi:serine/threonine protein phosphatase 1
MKRILAISDIHGMHDEFVRLMKLIDYNPDDDHLVFLGDYVDRGPDSISCLQDIKRLTSTGAVALMGNHESMLLEVINDLEEGRLSSEDLKFGDDITGVYKTAYNLLFKMPYEESRKLIDFISAMPLKHMAGKYVFAHAGYVPEHPFEMQSSHTLLWAKEDFLRLKTPDNMCVIFGHTPTKYFGVDNDSIYKGVNRRGIDCGAVFGGNLACFSINIASGAETEYYVKCERKWKI